MLTVYATREELEKAINDLDKVEKQGFLHSQAVFEIYAKSNDGDKTDMIVYDDAIILKGHPTDGHQNWGHIKSYEISWYKCENGECKNVDEEI